MTAKSNLNEDKFEEKNIYELAEVLDETIFQISVEMLRQGAVMAEPKKEDI